MTTICKDKKHRVLLLAEYYLPGFKAGGPVRAIASVVAALKNECSIEIFTRGNDFGEAPYVAGQRTWTADVDGARVRYFVHSRDMLRAFGTELRTDPPDVIYLNSFVSPAYSIAPMALMQALNSDVRVAMAPRGELMAHALERKPWRKRALLEVATRMPAYSRAVWSASGPDELTSIQAHFPNANVALNGEILARASGPLVGFRNRVPRLLFVGRICENKGLRELIEAVSSIDSPFELDVVGPEESASYAATCRAIASRSGSDSRVHFRGGLDFEAVRKHLAAADIFVLPTYGENFSHAIGEAMSAGLLPVIGKNTPWSAPAAKALGPWAIANTPEEIARSLRHLLRLPDVSIATLRREATLLPDVVIRDDVIDTYRSLLALPGAPSGARI